MKHKFITVLLSWKKGIQSTENHQIEVIMTMSKSIGSNKINNNVLDEVQTRDFKFGLRLLVAQTVLKHVPTLKTIILNVLVC
jgi:hypothetical protein